MTRNQTRIFITTLPLTSLVLASCTGQMPGSFRFAQQEQTFSSQQEVNTKIDLLWVVDNSASMDISQRKLRNGFASFAQKYMQPTWDIRVAVITTDTYMSNPAFSTYLSTTIPFTTGWTSPHIASRLASFVNPSWSPSLVNLSTGAFTSGVKFGDLVPVWGAQFGRLLPGYHDGPIPALCSEILPYFLSGTSHCATRDNQTLNTGIAHCLSPDAGAGESSVSQCVNTVQNNSIHSGKAIISTMPPAGTPGDSAWTQQLVNDFMVNVTTGSAGQGSERGLGSVLQLLSDNEPTDTAFFRANSLRGIIFVSDEEDQTLEIPETIPAGFKPQTYYKCDQATLLSINTASAITGNNGYCCDDPAKNCTYGSEGTSCPSKTVDGYTYTPTVCAREDKLVPVADVKTKLDAFFNQLDGTEVESPNYFVVSIIAQTAQAIQSLQAERSVEDLQVTTLKTRAVDRGDRYMQLGELVANGSIAMNIADEDYSPILESIGRAILEKKSTFNLARIPSGAEDMVVQVKHLDGSVTNVDYSKFKIVGKSLIVTDSSFILGLSSTDSIVINYQPKTAN